MDLADLVEAHLNGQAVEVPAELRADFHRAVLAHSEMRGALNETIVIDGRGRT